MANPVKPVNTERMMSKAPGGTDPQPPPHDSIRALLRAGHNDQAIVRLCAIAITAPDDLVAKELLFDAFFQKRDWAPALVLAEQLVRGQPDNARLQRLLIATLSNMKRFEEAIAHNWTMAWSLCPARSSARMESCGGGCGSVSPTAFWHHPLRVHRLDRVCHI